ncbi:MAG: 50S ribosomal protein L22 [Actinobacteria bacterium]|nr:50S ribosomal protein L22 [Actinomycetota bacterium]
MATASPDVVRVRAQAKWVRMSAQKARLVLDHVRGRSVPEARTILAFTPRAAAREIDRVLRSAVANAESVHGFDGDELRIGACYADEGPTLKRWQARARGRVNRIHKRTCHITIVLEPDPKAAGRPRRERKKAADEAPPPETTAPETAAPESEAETEESAVAEKPKRRTPAKKKETAV